MNEGTMIINKNRVQDQTKHGDRRVSFTCACESISSANNPKTTIVSDKKLAHLNFCQDVENNNGITRHAAGKKPRNWNQPSVIASSNRRRSYGSIGGAGSTDDDPIEPDNSPSVADIISDFGWFQFFVLLFSGLREAAVGYDAVVMSILLQPETKFQCADGRASERLVGTFPALPPLETTNFTRESNITTGAQCFRDTAQTVRCQSWSFPESSYGGKSLVADWSLVCDRHWLVAFIESVFFFGLVTGNLVWGFYADKVGRRQAYLVAHTVALLAGSAAIFMPTVESFAICRFFSAFGLIGYNIIYSIQIELIGTKYRAFSTTMNHLGWGLGVICVPLVNHLFTQYRYLIAMAPLLTLIMYPFAFLLPESSRWLMAHGRYDQAKQELYRAAKFNGKKVGPNLEKKISMLKAKVINEKLKQCVTQCDNRSSYKLLFTNPKLVRDTLILSHISFTGHLFYYLLTINFAYIKNLSIEANFITSGAGEWISVLVGAALLKYCSRKTCMSIFLFAMACSFVFQAAIDSGLAPSLSSEAIITANNGIGTLSALLLVFVTLIVNQEVYPTVIRQTGSSIVNTLGEMGSTLAPMLLYLATSIGLWKADMMYAFACAAGIIGVQFLTKTDDIELSDN